MLSYQMLVSRLTLSHPRQGLAGPCTGLSGCNVMAPLDTSVHMLAFSVCSSCSSAIVSSPGVSSIRDKPTSTTDNHWVRSSTVCASSACVLSCDNMRAPKSRARMAGPKEPVEALELNDDELLLP